MFSDEQLSYGRKRRCTLWLSKCGSKTNKPLKASEMYPRITLPLAMKTLNSITQRGWRYIEDQFTWRFRTRQAHMQYPHLRSGVFTDTLFNDTTIVRGNNCAQLFVTDDGHSRIYPLPSKGQAFDKLALYCSSVGIPLFLLSDNSGWPKTSFVTQALLKANCLNDK